jgi:uncharacterized protein (TIGR02466 family)
MDHEIIEVLPTQIFKFKYPGNLDYILDLLKREEYIFVDTKYKTTNFSLHKKFQYKKFFEWVHSCLQFVKEQNQYQCDSLEITQCWANKYKDSEYIHPHVHPNSVVSGIFYANQTNSGTIFGKVNPWTVGLAEDISSLSISSLWLAPNHDDECYNLQRVEPESGFLYLFPSNLRHATEINVGNERYTISFNSFPSGKIGNDDLLASVRIKVL